MIWKYFLVNIFLSINISRLCGYQHNFFILSSLFFNCDLMFNHRAFFVNLNDTYNVGEYVIKITRWLNKLDMHSTQKITSVLKPFRSQLNSTHWPLFLFIVMDNPMERHMQRNWKTDRPRIRTMALGSCMIIWYVLLWPVFMYILVTIDVRAHPSVSTI